MVPLLAGILGSKIPARTWFGALMSIVGVGMLESSGSPPCVSVFYISWFICFLKIFTCKCEEVNFDFSSEYVYWKPLFVIQQKTDMQEYSLV